MPIYVCIHGLKSHPWDSETGKPCEWPPEGVLGKYTRQCVTHKRLLRAMEQQRLLRQGSLAAACVDCEEKKVPFQLIPRDGIPVCAACQSVRERKPYMREYGRRWRAKHRKQNTQTGS